MILTPVLMINILKNLKKIQNNTRMINFRKKRNKNFPGFLKTNEIFFQLFLNAPLKSNVFLYWIISYIIPSHDKKYVGENKCVLSE